MKQLIAPTTTNQKTIETDTHTHAQLETRVFMNNQTTITLAALARLAFMLRSLEIGA